MPNLPKSIARGVSKTPDDAILSLVDKNICELKSISVIFQKSESKITMIEQCKFAWKKIDRYWFSGIPDEFNPDDAFIKMKDKT